MADWDWSLVLAALIGGASAFAAQLLIGRGEPGKLKTLRILNELISGYITSDSGKDDLVNAREKYAKKVAASYVKPGLGAKLARSPLGQAALIYFIGVAGFFASAMALLGPQKAADFWVGMLPIGRIFLLAAVVVCVLLLILGIAGVIATQVGEFRASPFWKRRRIRHRARKVKRLALSSSTPAVTHSNP